MLNSPVTPPNSKMNSVARNLFSSHPSQSPATRPKKGKSLYAKLNVHLNVSLDGKFMYICSCITFNLYLDVIWLNYFSVEYDKTSQLYVVTKLTEMNTKINKLVLDMSRQEDLLKDVLKIVKFQDKSIDDDDDYDYDIFLEGFPIDDLESLREINSTLKNDAVYCKKLACIFHII